LTVGELNDRRARKKAETRTQVRTTAQQLFAERGFDAVTIADIAAEADVAVQTVFNHFATKEDLFFDGRTPWVDGPAEAVRTREPSVPPLPALKGYLVAAITELAGAHDDERRRFLATIEASPALRTRELQLVHEAERRLSRALEQAWADEGCFPDPATAAALTAATWLAVARVLLVSQRPPAVDSGPEAGRAVQPTEPLVGQLLGGLEAWLPAAHVPHAAVDARRPAYVRQAG
jgi:AcrR family transcriptional regulator